MTKQEALSAPKKEKQHNRQNYQRILETILQANAGERPRLLLHACCAPCSSYVLEYLSQYFAITILFYNPNISTEAEYQKRAEELVRLIREMGLSEKIAVLVPPYDHKVFLAAAKGLEREPERGARCLKCYELRLLETARVAAACKEEAVLDDAAFLERLRGAALFGGAQANAAQAVMDGFDYICTTLTISPLKDAEVLNEIGARVAEQYGQTYLPSDFKKKGGYQRSVELSQLHNLYRQNFCGCEFSR